MGVPILRIVKGADRIAAVNLIENPSFETNTTGYAAVGSNLFYRTTARAFSGTASGLCVYRGSATLVQYVPVGVETGKSYVVSSRVWVPDVYSGQEISIQFVGYSGATATGTVNVWNENNDPRDEWVTISAYIDTLGADIVGTVGILELAAAGNGDYFWTDGWQLESVDHGRNHTPYFDGSYAGSTWSGSIHASTSTRAASERKKASLLGPEFYLNETRMQIAQYKNGGTYSSSPFADGQQLVDVKYENVIETFNLKVVDDDQDAISRSMQDIRELLIDAVKYWVDDWETEPVWIEAKAANETNTRYAVLYNGFVPEDENPWGAPFLQPRGRAVMDNIDVIVERGHWLGNEPGVGTPVALSAVETYDTGLLVAEESISVADVPTLVVGTILVSESESVGVADVQNISPISAFPAASNDDAYAIYDTSSVTLTGNMLFGHDGSGRLDCGIRFANVTIPPYATILSANLTVTAAATSSSDMDDVWVAVQFRASPAPYSNWTDFLFKDSEQSTAIVWNISTTTWTSGNTYTSPDLTLMLQDFIDQFSGFGWSKGNYMNIMLLTQSAPSGNQREIYSQDTAGAGQLPRLDVTFTV